MNNPSERASGGRFLLIDILRGVAILAMIVYHFGWDLSYFGLIAVDVASSPGWVVFARTIAATFIGLVGVNLTLASRKGIRWPAYGRRLGLIVGAAAIVSLGTYWLDPQSFVFFGILHCIALASVLALLFLRLPGWLLVVAAIACFVAPEFLKSPVFNGHGWYWLGLSTEQPGTVDYVPMLPWFGVVLIGMVAGRVIVAHRENRLLQWHSQAWWARFLATAGRWSLAIYLIHQPVLMGSLILLAPYLQPGDQALAEPFGMETEASCRSAGYPEEDCRAYAQCVVAALLEQPGLLAAAHRRVPDDEQQAVVGRTVGDCAARTL